MLSDKLGKNKRPYEGEDISIEFRADLLGSGSIFLEDFSASSGYFTEPVASDAKDGS